MNAVRMRAVCGLFLAVAILGASWPVLAQTPAEPIALGVHMPRDLSPWSMFLAADNLVKAVMIALGLASVVTWTIFFAKTAQIARARRRLTRTLKRMSELRTLAEAQMTLGSAESIVASLLRAAIAEIKLSSDSVGDEGIKERTASRFSEITRAEAVEGGKRDTRQYTKRQATWFRNQLPEFQWVAPHDSRAAVEVQLRSLAE